MNQRDNSDSSPPSVTCTGAKDVAALTDLYKWHERELARNFGHQRRFERIGPANRANMHRKVSAFHLKACQTILAFLNAERTNDEN